MKAALPVGNNPLIIKITCFNNLHVSLRFKLGMNESGSQVFVGQHSTEPTGDIVIIRETNKIKMIGFSLWSKYQYEEYLSSYPSSATTSCGILDNLFKLAGPQFLHL